MKLAGDGVIDIDHPFLGPLELLADSADDGAVRNAVTPTPLFCENETNNQRLFGSGSVTKYPKDGINDHVVNGAATVNPEQEGTKAAFWHRLEVAPGLPKNKTLPVVLVCASGKRAAKAAKALEAKGYTKAVVLAGGLTAWKAANMPVETVAAAA